MTYNDQLNEIVDKFMAKHELEDITEKTVLDYFGGKSICNQYGNVFHALVHHKYSPKKVFKMIEIFMNWDNANIDINYKGEYTGYHFIQLALYGYTVDGKDFSYTTEFILDLIKIAKKYNLDVNTVDKDGDTIIHTAIASEVYEGKTIPLLMELGLDFDIKKKDNDGNDIYEALLNYKKEAAKGGSESKKWLNRLSNEENEIKTIVEKGNFTLEGIDSELDKIKVELEKLGTSISNDLFSTFNEIKKCIGRLNYFLEKRKLFSLDNNTIYHELEEKVNKKIVQAVNVYLKALLEEPITDKFNELDNFLQTNSFIEELKILKEGKKRYEETIREWKKKINSSNCIVDLIVIRDDLEKFKDESVKQELLSLVEERKNNLDEIIKNIESLMSKTMLIENWGVTSGVTSFEVEAEENIDFNLLDKEVLLKYYQDKLNEFEKFKEMALVKFGELVYMINSFTELTDNGILTLDELKGLNRCENSKKNSEKRRKKTIFEVLNGK